MAREIADDTPMACRFWFLGASCALSACASGSYSPAEVGDILDYWSHSAKYEVRPSPRESRQGRYQVRLTASGSLWLKKFNAAKGLSGKVSPTSDAVSTAPAQVPWEQWVSTKIAWDRYQAGLECQRLNTAEIGKSLPALETRPPEPGPMPLDLMIAMKNEVPVFAAPVQPKEHAVTFHDRLQVVLEDNVSVRPTYVYYRFPQGVSSEGTSMDTLSPQERDRLYRLARLNMSVQRVMNAVSGLEGGFDSINTYDTGYVSAGFIQFACLGEGGGSLGELLATCKANDPFGFEADFRSKGIDVEGTKLVAMDLTSGQPQTGPDAAMTIINDKRLTSIFVRAGRVSDLYRVQQLRTAFARFYPADDRLTLKFAGQTWNTTVAQVIQSEVGIATLMDRKVNTGNLGNLAPILNQIAERNKCEEPADLAKFESEVIAKVRWRRDFSKNADLSRPNS